MDHRDSPYDVSVNVVFLGGADFDPPPPLGTTDRTRYLKVTTLEEGNDRAARVDRTIGPHAGLEMRGRPPGGISGYV
jgi:hypothetical protein